MVTKHTRNAGAGVDMESEWSPSNPEQTRRTVLQTAVAALATGTLGTVAGRVDDVAATGEDHTDAPSVDQRLGYAPADAVIVSSLHASELLDDPAGQAVLDAQFGADGGQADGPRTLREAGTTLDEATAVSMTDVREALQVWLPAPDDGLRHATVFWTDWARGDVVASMESVLGIDLEKTTDHGYPRYRPRDAPADDSPTAMVAELGVVDDGVFVIGSETAVSAVLDTVAGEGDRLGAPLEPAFDALPAGPAQFAVDVPQDQLRRAGIQASGRAGLVLLSLASVSLVRGAMSVEGDRRRFTTTFEADSPWSARLVASVLRRLTDEERPAPPGPLPTLPVDAAVTRSGSAVTVESVRTISEIADDADRVANQIPGSFLGDPLVAVRRAPSMLGADGGSGAENS